MKPSPLTSHKFTLVPAILILTGILCAALAAITPAIAATKTQPVDAGSVMERAERIRFPDQGFQVDIKVTSEVPGRNPDIRNYRVLSKNNDNTLVMTTAPAIDRGQILLMKERDLWLFMPSVSQPIRLPLSQRLTGQVANGDLARAKFIGDYDASIVRTETIDDQDYFLLELLATRRRVTYRRILYWVHSTTFRPAKAEFHSVSKRLLKTCYYRNFQSVLGTSRPTQLLIIDAVRKGHRSVLDYSNMKLRQLPDKVFTKQYLKKLQ